MFNSYGNTYALLGLGGIMNTLGVSLQKPTFSRCFGSEQGSEHIAQIRRERYNKPEPL
jgi:hypothetical protein